MSIRQKSAERRTVPIPELHNGDRLTQREFHRRYEAMPENVKAELIGGIVYMASPLRRPHAKHDPDVLGVFWMYAAGTPGVEVAHNGTTILGDGSEPQPDGALRILPEYGGLASLTPDEYWCGAAELLAEVAHSSAAVDLHDKKSDYREAGILEYLVFDLNSRRVYWFDLANNTDIQPDKVGVLRSRVFPGLWIGATALVAGDSAELIKIVQRGLASPEHAAFVKKLEAQRRKLAKKKARR